MSLSPLRSPIVPKSEQTTDTQPVKPQNLEIEAKTFFDNVRSQLNRWIQGSEPYSEEVGKPQYNENVKKYVQLANGITDEKLGKLFSNNVVHLNQMQAFIQSGGNLSSIQLYKISTHSSAHSFPTYL